MEPEPSFPTDLYRGTAPYYDQFRPAYPEAMLEDLCRRLPVSGTGRLLDLACGTGQIAFPLAGRFAEVVAVDQEPESVAFAQRKAEEGGVTNIGWLAGAAQTVELEGPLELVAVGNAFHRLDRPAVARRMFSWLEPGGGVALLWGGTPGRGSQLWQRALSALYEEWMAKLGVTDRVPAAWEEVIDRYPHEQVLAEAGFHYEGEFGFTVELAWTVESLAGFSYTTSFLNREVLGGRVAEFEMDLADRLGSCAEKGAFHEEARFAYQLARKPAAA
ncbi:MAG TPA: class I SAM-dependent methyltransferase [Acidimicrobiales bacterium]|nr:class I SAM-dependent methyltransferase [Acidimicrobiales bacterium]